MTKFANANYTQPADLLALEQRELKMTREEQQRFEEVTRPVIKWLCENVHPHHTIIITPTNAELLEGQCSTGDVFDYVKD